MIINKICFSVTEKEVSDALINGLQRMPPEAAEQLKKVKDPTIVFKPGMICFKCKFAMGFLPVPVEAQIELKPANDGTALAIRLAKVSMAMMGGNTAATALMGQLAQAIAGKPGMTVEGDTLTIELKQLAAMKGLIVNGNLNTLSIEPGLLTLELD